jgi:hypothetical protein
MERIAIYYFALVKNVKLALVGKNNQQITKQRAQIQASPEDYNRPKQRVYFYA